MIATFMRRSHIIVADELGAASLTAKGLDVKSARAGVIQQVGFVHRLCPRAAREHVSSIGPLRMNAAA